MRILITCLVAFSIAINFSFTANQKKLPLLTEEISPADTFPVPPGKKNRLFYVQRNHNINTIVYDVNYNSDSTLNEDEPVHAYWIRYADKGETLELSYLQKHYAYGVHAKLIDREKKTYKLNFVSYSKRDMYLKYSTVDKRYHTYITIQGKLCVLTRVYIHIEGGTFWVPHVKYIELKGRDLSSNAFLTERFIP